MQVFAPVKDKMKARFQSPLKIESGIMQEHVAWKSRTISREAVQNGPVKPFRRVSFEPLSRSERAMKRSLDLTLGLAALLFLLPFLLLVAAAIFSKSGGPVIFRQQRGGLNGKPFTIWKFRTMRVLEDGEKIAQVRKSDPRVTRLGAVLRRTSIDELPQLWNVVRGDMSIVGPRPHALAHDRHYGDLVSAYSTRQCVKPGLTGLAQVEGCRGETSSVDAMEKRVLLDIAYIETWSFWLDLKIIMRTAKTVLFEKDVY